MGDEKTKNLLAKKLRKTVKKLIDAGCVTFVAGGAVGFDMLASLEVLKLKKRYKHIRLEIMLPCKNFDLFWNEKNKQTQSFILKNADKVSCLAERYYSGCMFKRNRAMIDASDCCIAYLNKQEGGTFFTVCCAEKKNIPILNLA